MSYDMPETPDIIYGFDFSKENWGWTPGDAEKHQKMLAEIDEETSGEYWYKAEFDDKFSYDSIHFEVVDSEGQLLNFRVGPCFSQNNDISDGLWVYYQNKYMRSKFEGPVLLSPETVWNIGIETNAKLFSYWEMFQLFYNSAWIKLKQDFRRFIGKLC